MKNKFIKLTILSVFACLLTLTLAACGEQGLGNQTALPANTDTEAGIINQPAETIAPEVADETTNYPHIEKASEEDVQSTIHRRDQVLDFRGWEHLDSEQKEWVQEYLNNLGNPTEGYIDFIGFESIYTVTEYEHPDGEIELIPDGGLYVIAFIRNGLDTPIGITEVLMTLLVEEEVIENNVSRMERITVASGYFNGSFGTLLPSQSIIYKFTFGDEHVLIKDADLSKYNLSCEYWY